jgi:hypothetical protein
MGGGEQLFLDKRRYIGVQLVGIYGQQEDIASWPGVGKGGSAPRPPKRPILPADAESDAIASLHPLCVLPYRA